MFRKLLKINAILIPLILFFFFSLPILKALAILLGILIGTTSILVSAWVLDNFWDSEWGMFVKVYFFSTVLRFIIALSLVGILLGTTKIDEIYFTVSFIISYLCNSITEMIFYNKILDKKSQ